MGNETQRQGNDEAKSPIDVAGFVCVKRWFTVPDSELPLTTADWARACDSSQRAVNNALRIGSPGFVARSSHPPFKKERKPRVRGRAWHRRAVAASREADISREVYAREGLGKPNHGLELADGDAVGAAGDGVLVVLAGLGEESAQEAARLGRELRVKSTCVGQVELEVLR